MKDIHDYDEGSEFDHWCEENRDMLKDSWESMGEVERFEEGPTFDDYRRNQYDNSL